MLETLLLAMILQYLCNLGFLFCKNVDYAFDQSRSFAVYEDVASKIIKRFKYGGKKYCARYIAELMILNNDYFKDIDLITFVPIGNKRRKERGFNQAKEIAQEISKILGVKIIDALEKIGNERHQAGLSQQERQKNLSGSFKLKSDIFSQIKGKNILIIDDVFTTGATLSECAKIIKEEKPKSVSALTFAKTKLISIN